jgi:hypothetical protein
MSDETEAAAPTNEEVIDELKRENAALKNQVATLTARVQAAVNQRNVFADEAIVLAGELTKGRS